MMISHLLDGVLFSLIRLAMIGYKINIERAISEVEMDEGIPLGVGCPPKTWVNCKVNRLQQCKSLSSYRVAHKMPIKRLTSSPGN